jgi:DNA-binding beta-propeller fold protein YncE
MLSTGEICVADYWNQKVHVFTTSGSLLHEWTTLGIPVGVAADEFGRLFVITLGGSIYRYTSVGVIDAAWRYPEANGYYWGVDIEIRNGIVYAASNTISIGRYTLDGEFLGTIHVLGSLKGITVGPGGDVYAADFYRHEVCHLDPNGAPIGCWGSFGSGHGQLNEPTGMTVTSDGHVLVADEYNHRISVWTVGGQFVCTWGNQGTALGEFNFPGDIVVGRDGGIYVADGSNFRVQKFGDVPTGVSRRSWGQVKALYR